MKVRGLVVAALMVAAAVPVSAQDIRGYYLHVLTGSREAAFSPSGIGDVQRLRLMGAPAVGPVTLDLAYEHALAYTSEIGLREVTGEAGGGQGGTGWIRLQGTIAENDKLRWSHRFDRLAAVVSLASSLEVVVGRQPISWATTLFLTPGDPFLPFDPAEPFREYRAGVDAVRVRAFTGNFTDVEVVVRPSDPPAGRTITLLGRGRTVWRGIEAAVWAGGLHDHPALGIGVTAPLLDGVVRGEGVVRRAAGRTVTRVAIGVDRSFPVVGKDLYVVAEYQHDGFGARDASELLEVLRSAAFARRELQVVGRDVLAVQGSLQPHPLVGLALLTVVNLSDESLLVVPSLSYSAGDELTVQGGLFHGIGPDVTSAQLPASEYGPVPTTIYVSLTAFF